MKKNNSKKLRFQKTIITGIYAIITIIDIISIISTIEFLFYGNKIEIADYYREGMVIILITIGTLVVLDILRRWKSNIKEIKK